MSISVTYALTDILLPNETHHIAYEGSEYSDFWDDPSEATTQFTSDQYDNINESDDTRESTAISLGLLEYGSVAQMFTFNLSKYTIDVVITNITYVYEGYGTNDCSYVDKDPYIMYRADVNVWHNDQTMSSTESTKSREFTSSISSVTRNDQFKFGVITTGFGIAGACDLGLYTDFVRLEITYRLLNASNLTECATLSRENQIYTLTQDVSTTGTCFTINANNITLDCDGHTITCGGGVSSTKNFTTVKNCNIKNTGGSIKKGIALSSNTNNGLILNNNITMNSCVTGCPGIFLGGYPGGESRLHNVTNNNITVNIGSTQEGSYAISLEYADSNTISNNNVMSSKNFAIVIKDSDSNDVFNNNITTSDTNAYGIYVYGADSNNIFDNNITSVSDYAIYLLQDSQLNNFTNNEISSAGGIRFDSGDQNNFTNMNIQTTGSKYGIYLKDTNLNRFFNSTINASNQYDIYVEGTNQYVNYLINCSFNQSEVTFQGGATDKIQVRWYLDVYVNDTSRNPINQANVSAWDTYGIQVFSELTDSSGYITRKELIEYNQSATGKTYYTNYTVNASKTNYFNDSKQINLTQSMLTYLTISKEHETYGTLISTTKSKDWYITQVIPTWSSYEPTGTSITIYVSANGGTDWEEVANGTKHTFSNSGKQFKYKAIFQTSDVYTTPILYNVNFYYSTIPNETVTIRTEANRNVYVGFFDVTLTGSETTYKDKFQKSYTLP